MTGFSRTLKYSAFVGLRTYLYSMALAILYSAYLGLLLGRSGSPEAFFVLVRRCVQISSLAMISTYGMFNAVTVLHGQLSSGCTRMCGAIGQGISGLISAVLSYITLVIWLLIGKEPGLGQKLSLYAGELLFMVAISLIGAALIQKFGRMAYIGFCCFCGVTIYILAANEGSMRIFARFLNGDIMFVVTSIILVLIGQAILVFSTRKIEVRV